MNAEATFAQNAATWSHRGNEWVSSPKTMHNNNHIRKNINPKIATIDPVSRRNPRQSAPHKSPNEHMRYAAKVPSLGPNGSSSSATSYVLVLMSSSGSSVSGFVCSSPKTAASAASRS